MRRNEIILPKLILLLWYFINQEVIQFFLVIPESFLTLILCQFWHEHTCSVSYQKDPALFDSFKIPHQVVAVVNDTVWALELASLSKNKFLFTALAGQHNKINLFPSRKGRQLSIVLRRQAEIIVCDMNVRRLCNSCCTQWVKNNPVVGLRMGINICFWATELEIGDSSSKAYPSSSHNSTRRILSNRARHKWLELESLPELESQSL